MLVCLNYRYRNLISFLSIYRDLDIVNEIYNVFSVSGCCLCKALVFCIFPACRYIDLNNTRCSGIDCIEMCIRDRLSSSLLTALICATPNAVSPAWKVLKS